MKHGGIEYGSASNSLEGTLKNRKKRQFAGLTTFSAMKKEFAMSDGTVWKPARVERPFVLTD